MIIDILENKSKNSTSRILTNGYYGSLQTDKTLVLNFDEALHLLERGVIKITENEKILSLSECTKIFTENMKGFRRKINQSRRIRQDNNSNTKFEEEIAYRLR